MRDIRIHPLHFAFGAFRETWAGIDSILRLSWFPVLLVAVAVHLLTPGSPVTGETGMPPDGILRLAVLAIAGLMVQAMIAVAWHRTMLAGFDPSRVRIYIRFGFREFLYGIIAVFLAIIVFMGLYVVTGMVAALLAATFGVSGPLGQIFAFLIGMVPAILIVARSSLVLPSIALGQGADLIRSWQVTRGHGAQISATLILVCLPLVVVSIVLIHLSGMFVERGFGGFVGLVVNYVNMIVNIVMMCFVVTALNLFFAELRRDKTDEEPQA